MDTQRLRQVETLFWEALGLDERQLDALLTDRCGEDYLLKEFVIALVERDRNLQDSHFLAPVPSPIPIEEEAIAGGAIQNSAGGI